MGITNIFRSQLSAVIQWQADKQHLLWYKYPSKTDEIKNASKLIVGPGRVAGLRTPSCGLRLRRRLASPLRTEDSAGSDRRACQVAP